MSNAVPKLSSRQQPTTPSQRTHVEQAFLDRLTERGKINHSDNNRVRSLAARTGEPVTRLLSQLAVLEEKDVVIEAADFLGCEIFESNHVPQSPCCDAVLKTAFLKYNVILPLNFEDGVLAAALADPFSASAIQALRLATGAAHVAVFAGEPSAIEAALVKLYDGSPVGHNGNTPSILDHTDDLERLKDLAAEAPVIKYVNGIIHDAVDLKASDIHLEPFHNEFRVRYRVDGLLREAPPPPTVYRAAVISRIKLTANMNIAERRLPQDGRVRVAVKGKEIDLRISTVPTMYGESVVMRILDQTAVHLDLRGLGFSEQNFERYLSILSKPTGIVLVTGPTGSGKTTTLYASLLRLSSVDNKVMTVEDPVEYELPGINQMQVKPGIGLTFANALRSIVRQDPDIILIGEVRDVETAEIACQASLTGHKVFSTLHTNDAVSTVMRLLDMGVPDFLIGATLEGVVAQRLARKLCPFCKVPETSSFAVQRLFERFDIDFKGQDACRPGGCARCDHRGFKGRAGIYEIIAVDAAFREQIHKRASVGAMRETAIRNGMRTLLQDGMEKVASGMTTTEEILRVCGQ